MDQTVITFNQRARSTKTLPTLRIGDIIRVTRRIREGDKERSQMFEGMVIALRGGQSSSPMATVRKIAHGVGVELILPLLAKTVDKIDIVKHAKVRRAKLYYLRGRTAKNARLKFIDTTAATSKAKDSKAKAVAAESATEKVAA